MTRQVHPGEFFGSLLLWWHRCRQAVSATRDLMQCTETISEKGLAYGDLSEYDRVPVLLPALASTRLQLLLSCTLRPESYAPFARVGFGQSLITSMVDWEWPSTHGQNLLTGAFVVFVNFLLGIVEVF